MKDIYELLNDIDIDDFDEVEVDDLEKERVKKNLKKTFALEGLKRSERKNNKLKKGALIAGLAFFITIGVTSANPTFASKIPIIGEFFQKVYGNRNDDFLKYSDCIDKTKASGGIEVTFHSAAISNDTMFLDFTVKNNNENITDENMHNALLIPKDMKFNGKDVTTGAGADWNIIDDNTIRIIKNVKIASDGDFAKGIIDVEIVIDELFGVKGDFGIKFKYDKTIQDKLSVNKDFKKDMNINGIDIEIREVSASPLTSSISFEGVNDDFWDEIGFLAFDNNGNLLQAEGMTGSGDGFLNKYRAENSYISSNGMESVTFIPYYRNGDRNNFDKAEETKVVNVGNNDNTILKGTEEFGLKINEVIRDGEFIIIKYNDLVFGKEAFRSGISTRLYLNENGKIIYGTDDEKVVEVYRKYNTDDFNIRVFKVDEGTPLEIGFEFDPLIKFYKEEEITVNLPK